MGALTEWNLMAGLNDKNKNARANLHRQHYFTETFLK